MRSVRSDPAGRRSGRSVTPESSSEDQGGSTRGTSLLPQGKAVLATESKINAARAQQACGGGEAREGDEGSLGALRDRLQALKLEVVAKAGEEGKLFGSVTAAQIVADMLAEKGFEIDRRKIAALRSHIKEVGEHKIPVRLRK